LAAKNICGIDIKEEFREFNAWNRKWITAGNSILWYDAIVPKEIKKKISRFIINQQCIAKTGSSDDLPVSRSIWVNRQSYGIYWLKKMGFRF